MANESDERSKMNQDFEKAASGEKEQAIPDPPATPNLEMHLRPDGAIVQAVHTQIDDAARAQQAGQAAPSHGDDEKDTSITEEFNQQAAEAVNEQESKLPDDAVIMEIRANIEIRYKTEQDQGHEHGNENDLGHEM